MHIKSGGLGNTSLQSRALSELIRHKGAEAIHLAAEAINLAAEAIHIFILKPPRHCFCLCLGLAINSISFLLFYSSC